MQEIAVSKQGRQVMSLSTAMTHTLCKCNISPPQKKIHNVYMPDSVPAHVDFVKAHNIFWRSIRNRPESPEFPRYRFSTCKKVADLNKAFFAVFDCHKINFTLVGLAGINGETA